jgi:hypothetical protein
MRNYSNKRDRVYFQEYHIDNVKISALFPINRALHRAAKLIGIA